MIIITTLYNFPLFCIVEAILHCERGGNSRPYASTWEYLLLGCGSLVVSFKMSPFLHD